MISFNIESKPSRRDDDHHRRLEVDASRAGLRIAAYPKTSRLWCLTLDLRRISKPEWAEQEKSGLHVSPRDNDDWNTVYYRRPGSRYYACLVIGRRKTWFEKTLDKTDRAEQRATA